MESATESENKHILNRKRSSSTECAILNNDPVNTHKASSEKGDNTIIPEFKSDQSQDSLDIGNKSAEVGTTTVAQSAKTSLSKSLSRANSRSTASLHANQAKGKSKLTEPSIFAQAREILKTNKEAFSSSEAPKESFLKSGRYNEWLECDKKRENNQMQLIFFCRWCKSLKQDVDFARGVVFSQEYMLQNGLKTKVFKEHVNTSAHKSAKEAFLRESFGNEDFSSSNEPKDAYTEKLYNTVGLLLDLLKNNLTLETSLEVLKNAASRDLKLSSTDISFISLRELIKTMAESLKDKLIHEINSSPYFSLILCPWPPGSSSSTRSFEIVCYYIKQGVPKHAYFDTIVLKDAEYCGLVAYKRLIGFLKKSNIEYQQKLVGLFTNGDILFNSKNAGVSDLLKKEITDIIAIHPLSYRYFSNSTQNYGITKAFPIAEHVFQLCIDTFHYFNSSQKHLKGLFENKSEIEELLLELSGGKNPGTKWSSLLAGVNRIVKTLGEVWSTLKQSNEFQAKTLEIHYKNPLYMAWMHFLADFGPYVTSIGGVFREKTLTLRGKVKAIMETKKKVQERFLSADSGIAYKEGCWGLFPQNLKEVEGKWFLYGELEMTGGLDIEKCEKDFRRFAEIFIEEVDRRYGSVYNLESLGMFDLAYLKEKAGNPNNWQVVVDRAKESVGKFLKFLGKEQFLDPLLQELPGLLKYLRENCIGDSKATTLNELFFFCQEKFPVSIDLISRYYVLPFNLSDIERSLRAFGKIQAKTKGSMADDLVRSILMLNLHAEEEGNENLIDRYVEAWKGVVFAGKESS